VAGPAVYAANHASALDIPIVFGYLPCPFRIFHKRSLYLMPGVGWALWLGGHVGIDRKNPFSTRRSLAAAAARIRSGTSVVVFPEGTRSRDENVQAFKRGSFHLALNAGVPVVPISLVGVKQVIPSGALVLRPGLVEMRIHSAIATQGRGRGEAAVLAGEVRERIVAGCAVGSGPRLGEPQPAPHVG
jgi:1-acyl-sn-glycerol-3-phosphate acyltransferase